METPRGSPRTPDDDHLIALTRGNHKLRSTARSSCKAHDAIMLALRFVDHLTKDLTI